MAQVRTLWRNKLLAPLGLPCGVIAIDGKSLGALDHDADGWGSGTRATTTARRIGYCGRCERC